MYGGMLYIWKTFFNQCITANACVHLFAKPKNYLPVVSFFPRFTWTFLWIYFYSLIQTLYFDVPSPEQCWFSVSCILLDILIGKEGLEFTKKYPIIYATDNSYEKKRWSLHVCQTLVIMFTLVIAIILLFLLPVSLKISRVSGCLAFE